APVTFDVVSVKPAQPDPATAFYWRSTGDGFSATTTVQNLIQNAWDFVVEDQIVNLPGWAKSDKFEIAAKMDPEAYAAFRKLSDEEQDRRWNRMMQAILADRFHMQSHESRVLPAYALVLAKGGPKLKPSSAQGGGWSTGRGRITGHRMRLSDLADLLSHALARIVVDQTSLKGNYDISLTWTPDDERGLPDSGPSLFTALQDQLGLRLQTTKAPVASLIVDHIEKPSAN
ncbi:MAG TPA: TIGR03435 family protein, partial [Acidobacteriaceae bacterium]|nr:TIGR03435 family protein [Acidobacteriaceae bacterium]